MIVNIHVFLEGKRILSKLSWNNVCQIQIHIQVSKDDFQYIVSSAPESDIHVIK